MIALLLLALAAPAWGGRLYRCDTGSGVTSYVSKRIPGAKCKLIGTYRPDRTRPGRTQSEPQARAPAPAPAAAVRTSAPAPSATPSAASAPRVVRGQVYSFIDANGVRNYTSVRPRGVPAAALRTIRYSYIQTCYACGAQRGVNFASVPLNTSAYDDEIRAAAAANGVEEAVVRAIIHAESAYNPLALSRAGAQGLMQLMPGTARRFGVADAFNPAQNISGGVQYLAWLLKRFNGDLTLAAAGYNAGEGAVDRYGGVPPYSETQRYVQRVGVLVSRYRSALGSTAAATAGGLSAR